MPAAAIPKAAPRPVWDCKMLNRAPTMTSSRRKLAGTLLLLALVVFYVFLATVLAAAVLPTAGPIAQLIYYAVAGLAWVPLAAVVISWMHRS